MPKEDLFSSKLILNFHYIAFDKACDYGPLLVFCNGIMKPNSNCIWDTRQHRLMAKYFNSVMSCGYTSYKHTKKKNSTGGGKTAPTAFFDREAQPSPVEKIHEL
jgi:hypothetical protein